MACFLQSSLDVPDLDAFEDYRPFCSSPVCLMSPDTGLGSDLDRGLNQVMLCLSHPVFLGTEF